MLRKNLGNILQLKIVLKGIKPLIWRRFLVSDLWTFHTLHRVIQIVMGWDNYHLYEFNVNGVRITYPDEDYIHKKEKLNSKRARIFEYIDFKGQKFGYMYDFGDSWVQEITIEKIFEDKIEERDKCPFCLDGERACPKEDCGGVSGYERLMKILKTGKDSFGENIKELKAWLGNWDPERFDLNYINEGLKKI